jgi:glycine dehydrogenase subunit 2
MKQGGTTMGISASKLRNFHAAKWSEPIILELSNEGNRGILIPEPEEEIVSQVGTMEDLVPRDLMREEKPKLPEISQPQVLRHFLRLSQETIGQDTTIDIGLGTCTMKYSPKINEQFVRSAKVSKMHPLQDDDTAQGILKIIYDFEQIMKEISGMDAFSFQPGSGGAAIYSNASVLKKYFEEKGEAGQRTQVITTILSHPLNAAAPATKGFEVISLMPTETGYPSIENLKAVVSEKTAGIFVTNPEDTGVFNPVIKEVVDIVHEAGGLCICDMADYNGLFGIVRAREMGADMCHFNLHKAFSSPHGCMGPGCGAQGVRKELAKYLPVPRVEFDGDRYFLDYGDKSSIGKIRQFYGVITAVIRAYAWVMSLGADGLKEVAEVAILNNNYMMKRLSEEVTGISIPWSDFGLHRLEQVRYSFEQLKKDTGVSADDVNRRMLDFGFQRFFPSHHPMIVAEPYTPEPTESYSKADIDEYVETLKHICKEAYTDPKTVKTAPHNSSIKHIYDGSINDYAELAVTWRAYKRLKELE